MHRPQRRFAALLALSVLMAAGLAACGDDDSTDTSASTTTPGPQGSAMVSLDMADFSFKVSGALTAGGTLKISNTGAELHMLAIGKLKPGKTLVDLQTALQSAGGPPEGEETGPTTTVAGGTTTTTAAGGRTTPSVAGTATTTTVAGGAGGAGGEEGQDPTADIITEIGLPGGVMSPGQTAEVSAANLDPGTYAVICFIPTEGEGIPHFAMGMVNQLEVVAGTAPPAPTAAATYKVASGKAVEGPATLPAGKQTLKFEAAAGSEQLEPGIAMVNPDSTFGELYGSVGSLFEEDAPPKGAAAQLPGQIVYAGFDMEDVTSFYLTVDLKPGNYTVFAFDTDGDVPETPVEILNIEVA